MERDKRWHALYLHTKVSLQDFAALSASVHLAFCSYVLLKHKVAEQV